MIEKVFLFKHLNEKELKEIEKFSLSLNLKRGEILFYEKEAPEFLHILVEGEAVVYKTDIKGNELIIHKFKAPSLIAELANLENIPYPANCRIISPKAKVLKVDFQKFRKFLKDESVCFNVMKSLLEKMKRLDKIILDNLILDTETKIAKFIYENDEAFESLKQHNIAKLLNIKPETLSRKMKKFKDLGIIEKKDNRLTVKDKEKIKDYFSW